MRKISVLLLAGAAALGFTSVGHAADLYIAPPPGVVHAPAPVGDWGGFYVGAFGGIGAGSSQWSTEAMGGFDADAFALQGYLLGVHAGVNIQHDSIVFGVEGDVAWANITGSDDTQSFAGVDTDLSSTVDWLSTIRGRIGFGTDAFLLYGTAGLSMAGVTSSAEISVGGTDVATLASNAMGVNVGVGAEAMVAENVSIRGQVLFHQFQPIDGTYDFGGGVGEVDFTQNLSLTTATVGVSVHF